MPPSPAPKSLQEILKQRQRSDFVGRDDYLTAFSDNLQLPVDDSRRRFLFNVWGQGGVGKSTLLNQFSKSAQEAKAATAYTDESETSLPEALGRFAEQFERQGYKLGHFSDRYRLFHQKKQELETDPEAPQGFSAFVGKTVVKAGVRLGRRVPVGGVAFDFVDEDALSNQAGEWASYVAKKLSNKDDIQLIQEPIEVLTPLFLQGLCKLAEQAPIALFFDTYEQTDEFLDSWLRDVLDGKYGDVPPNIVITIAGRHALADNHWAAYDGLIARFPLEPFTEEEAKQFLHRKGITNPKVVEVILHLSGRLPLLVATLAVGSPDRPDQVSEPSDTAVERFLKWVEDPKQRQVALAAALPRKFNRDIIAELTNQEDAGALFVWLKGMPFVKEQRDGWVYHQVVRTLMLRSQRLNSPKSWQAAHTTLEEYFDQCRSALIFDDNKRERDPDWQHYSLETLYHSLCAAPQTQLNPAVNGFLKALKNQRSFAAQWAEVMEWAGQDAESHNLKDLGQQLVEGLRAYDNDEYVITLEMFSKLLNDSVLEPRWRCEALAWRGDTYRLMDSYEDALRDLSKALAIEGDDEWTLAHRGLTYRQMERYEDALADLTCAIELKPDYHWAIAHRGLTYRQMERYEDALADLTCAIELKPDYHWAIAYRGLTYRQIRRYEDALADLTRAIELKPHHWAIAHRGLTYRQMERYEDALADLTRAIDLKPDYQWASLNRGRTYQMMKRYGDALSDFTRSIDLKPDDDWAIFQRGETYRRMECYDEALADFTCSIDLKPDNWLTITLRGKTYRLIEHYDEALADLTRAIELKPDADWVIVERGKTYCQMERYEDALTDLSRAIVLKPNDELAFTERGLVYQMLVNYKAALADFQQAVEISPQNSWNVGKLATMYLLLGNSAKALDDFNRSLQLKESDWDFYERGLAYRKLNQFELAQVDFQKAIQLVQQDLQAQPGNVQDLFNLAIYYLTNSQFDLSKQTYQQGLTCGATHTRIRAAVQDLSEFLKLFPGHPQATAFYNGLRKKLASTS